MSASDIVILSGARTPHGKFLGGLSSLSAAELGQYAFRAAVERSHIRAEDIAEVIVGNVVSAGNGQALHRQISLKAGLPEQIGGITINKVCGSGLKAIMLAANGIKAGEGQVYLAGGTESMSNAPYLNHSMRQGHKYGPVELKDALQFDGLWCSICDWSMGDAAEFIAEKLEVQRDELDQFAARSQQLAGKAIESGAFRDEIVPVTIHSRKGDVVIEDDEGVRADTSVEILAKLKPAFKENGIVTAGNAPGMNDGASAVVVASREYAEKNDLPVMARIVSYAYAAVDPAWIFYAPVKAIPLALEKAGWKMSDVDLVELNEAFGTQVLADLKGLEKDGHHIPLEKLNVNGGAIALGHPIGASGARVLITLMYALKARGLKRGLAALCLGGGEAVAMTIEIE